MFDHRLAALLGRTVAEMKAALTQREYLGWQKYWAAEPWGPYRDNVHAAIIAREVRRPQLRKGAKLELDDFMVVNPRERQREATANFLNMLRLIAKPGKAHGN
jgi:hypothetical protein